MIRIALFAAGALMLGLSAGAAAQKLEKVTAVRCHTGPCPHTVTVTKTATGCTIKVEPEVMLIRPGQLEITWDLGKSPYSFAEKDGFSFKQGYHVNAVKQQFSAPKFSEGGKKLAVISTYKDKSLAGLAYFYNLSVTDGQGSVCRLDPPIVNDY